MLSTMKHRAVPGRGLEETQLRSPGTHLLIHMFSLSFETLGTKQYMTGSDKVCFLDLFLEWSTSPQSVYFPTRLSKSDWKY